jgi:hypothetical protein
VARSTARSPSARARPANRAKRPLLPPVGRSNAHAPGVPGRMFAGTAPRLRRAGHTQRACGIDRRVRRVTPRCARRMAHSADRVIFPCGSASSGSARCSSIAATPVPTRAAPDTAAPRLASLGYRIPQHERIRVGSVFGARSRRAGTVRDLPWALRRARSSR